MNAVASPIAHGKPMDYVPANDLQAAIRHCLRPHERPEAWRRRCSTGMGDGELERILVSESTHEKFNGFALTIKVLDGRPVGIYKGKTLYTDFLVARVREYLRVPRSEDVLQIAMF